MRTAVNLMYAVSLGSVALTCLLVGALLTARTSLAATRVVPTNFGSIQVAINSSADGDTVLVQPGVYTEKLKIVAKNLVLRSADGPQTTTLSCSGLDPPLLLITTWDSTTNFLAPIDTTTLISGFTFTGAANGLAEAGAVLCEGEQCSPCVLNNIFANNMAWRGAGMTVQYFATPNILNNLFQDNEAEQGGGLAILYAAGPRVIDNTFRRNVAYGNSTELGQGGAILIDGYADALTLIQSNVINDNEADYGGAIAVLAGSDATIYGNTIVHNRSNRVSEPWRCAGVRVQGSTTTATIRNNIISMNDNGCGIEVKNATVTLGCNDVWHNQLGDYQGIAPLPSDFSTDPEFCSSSQFALQQVSPCLPENSGACGLVGAEAVPCSAQVGIGDERGPERGPLSLTIRRLSNGGAELILAGEVWESEGQASLRFLDVSGKVAYMASMTREAGNSFAWSGETQGAGRVASGIYFVKCAVGSHVVQGKILLLKR